MTAAKSPNPAGFNGLWTLQITDQIPKDFGFVEEYYLDLSTGQPSGSTGQVAPPAGSPDFPYTYTSADGTVTDLTGIVIPGGIGNIYSTSLPSVPAGSPDSGVGPGLVMAEDNTLGPYSPYQGRIYAAFVGYFNVSNPRTIRTRPPTPTSSWCPPTTAERPGATRCSSTTTRRSPTAIARRTTCQSDRQRPDHRPEPVPAGDRRRPVDRDRGHLVARCPRRRRQCPGRDLHHHQHRRRPDLRPPDLRQPAQDRRRRDHRPDERHRAGVR